MTLKITAFDEIVNRVLKNNPNLKTLRTSVEKELIHRDIFKIMRDKGYLDQLTFIGGTCIRLCYGGNRLSEDLDFTGGSNFNPNDWATFSDDLKKALEKKYQLSVSVSNPKETMEQKTSTWKMTIETHPKDPSKGSQKIHIDICPYQSYTAQPMIILNPYQIDGDSLIVRAESLEEIYTDKLIAFALRNRIKYRDIWDIVWLNGKNISPCIDLILKKLQERKVDFNDFLEKFESRRQLMFQEHPDCSFTGYQQEMRRFLALDQSVDLQNQWNFSKILITKNSAQINYRFESFYQPIEAIISLLQDDHFMSVNNLESKIKEILNFIRDSFENSYGIEDNIKKFVHYEWRSSQEFKKFKERLMPLCEIAKGYEQKEVISPFSDLEIVKIPIVNSCNNETKTFCIQMRPKQNHESLSFVTHVNLNETQENYDGIYRFDDGTDRKINVLSSRSFFDQDAINTQFFNHGLSLETPSLSHNIEKAIENIHKALKGSKIQGHWFVVNLYNWEFFDEEHIGNFLLNYQKTLSEKKIKIDWNKIQSIIFYPTR